MALTKQQLEANDKFFGTILSFSKQYIWPDENESYLIVDGRFTGTPTGISKLKKNVSNDFFRKNVKY